MRICEKRFGRHCLMLAYDRIVEKIQTLFDLDWDEYEIFPYRIARNILRDWIVNGELNAKRVYEIQGKGLFAPRFGEAIRIVRQEVRKALYC